MDANGLLSVDVYCGVTYVLTLWITVTIAQGKMPAGSSWALISYIQEYGIRLYSEMKHPYKK